MPYGMWNKHVLEWWKHKDDSDVLFLKYEDLKKDLSSNVRLIAKFLEKPVTEDTVNKIAQQCSFEEMAKNVSTFTLDGPKLLRKGEIGDWKNYFTAAVDERFENEVLKELRGTGLVFDFEP
ncbi:sulfotransferase 1B1-like [Montipora foliosa]|uniref:sulfotransferase 1B1-like n=1 Tax=Montipora foliosa TaxID=591990 RepID=UPI0035F13CA8